MEVEGTCAPASAAPTRKTIATTASRRTRGTLLEDARGPARRPARVLGDQGDPARTVVPDTRFGSKQWIRPWEGGFERRVRRDVVGQHLIHDVLGRGPAKKLG